MKQLFFICSLMLLIASPVLADSRFDEIDTNKDGYISWEEFQVAMPKMTRAAFDAINTSRSGKISLEEWEKFQHSHQKNTQGNMGMGMGGMGMQMPPGHPEGMPTMSGEEKTMLKKQAPEEHSENKPYTKPLVQPPSKK